MDTKAEKQRLRSKTIRRQAEAEEKKETEEEIDKHADRYTNTDSGNTTLHSMLYACVTSHHHE